MGLNSVLRVSSLCATLLCLTVCVQLAAAHVQLSYPPSISALDFLDNIRTKNLCGDEASGADNSGFWRLPKDSNNVVTTLKAGDVLNATWNLHYAHQGGWRFELYDSDAELVAVWNDTSHWGCNHDGTQQWVQLDLPPSPCRNCTLRLVRQALEWGPTYLFHSCAMVDVVRSNRANATCNGCSGHGTCVEGECVCSQDPETGFWEGTYCERQNECDEDEHCGEGGLCLDIGATSPPRKQCYCREGWFGDEVTPWAPGSMLPTRKCDKRSNLTIGDPSEWEAEYPNKQTSVGTGAFTVYYKIDEENEEIEFAIEAKTDNWVAVGMRAASIRGVPAPAASVTAAVAEGEPQAGAAAEGEPQAGAAAEGEPQTGAAAEGEPQTGENKEGYDKDMEGYDMEKEKEEGEDGMYAGGEGEVASEGEPGVAAEGEPGAAAEGEPGAAAEGEPGAAAEGEPAVAAEGEPAVASEGDGGSNGVCGPGEPTIATEDGFVLVNVEDDERNNTGRRLFAHGMPELEQEAMDTELPASRRMFIGRHIAQAASESESAAPAAGSGGPTLTFFGPPKCRNPLVDNPAAHPMINQDIVVGYARGNAFRVQDSFTPSRARPLPDVYFGGTDDILDAVGKEEDGTTYLKFRRRLQTDDKEGDYCIIEDVLYLMIYAYGQPEGDYTHVPNSSLETGRATNTDFYGRDELKFHGGGIGVSYEGRGLFGQVDFFQKPYAEGGCEASTLEGYDCMREVIPAAFVLHWRNEADGVALAGEATGAGWASIAFPTSPGQMVGAEAVIGWTGDGGDVIDVYRLTGKAADLVVPVTDAFDISDEEVEEVDGKTILHFTRKFDDDFQAEGPHDLLVAYHTTADDIQYHTGRQGVTVNFLGGEGVEVDRTAREVDNSLTGGTGSASSSTDIEFRSNPGACLPSTLEGFDCMIEAQTGDSAFMVHWALEEDVVRLAGQAPGTGFCALGWAETPGQMVGGRAVIGWSGSGNDQIGLYALNSKAASGIVPSSDFEIFDESVSEVDGTTIIQFSRQLDGSFLVEEDQPFLVAFSPDVDGLEYHGSSARAALTLNLNSGGASISVAEDLSTYWRAHGILMTIGWGILIPVGVMVARTLKDKNPLWFYVHVVANSAGLLAAIAGFAMALIKFEREDTFRHRQVGISVMALGFLQPLNAAIRPHPGGFLRDQWEWVHWTVGRAALVLAIWNIFTGLDEFEILEEVGSKKYHVMYGMWLMVLFLVYLTLEGRSQKIKGAKCQKDLQERVLLLEKNAATELEAGKSSDSKRYTEKSE